MTGTRLSLIELVEHPRSGIVIALLGIVVGTLASTNFPGIEFLRWLVIVAVLLVLCCYVLIWWFYRGVGLEELCGPWHSYHLTRNTEMGSEPYWVYGHFEIDKSASRASISGTHEDRCPPGHTHRYFLEGHLDGGAFLLLEKNTAESKKDNCLAYFNHMEQAPRRISGFWLGPNQDGYITVGPYILSREPIDVDELNKFAKAQKHQILKLKATNETKLHSEGNSILPA